MFHVTVNVNLMVVNIIQIKSGIPINANVSVKTSKILCIRRNPSTSASEINRYVQNIVDDLVITCGNIKDVPDTVS